MIDLDRRLHDLDLLDPPDLWDEALARSVAPARMPVRLRRRPLVALAAAVIGLVAIGGVLLAVTLISDTDTSPADEPTITPTTVPNPTTTLPTPTTLLP